MSSLLACLLALVAPTGGSAAAQVDDPSALALGALIARLPDVRHEWTGAGSEWRLDPASAELARRLANGVVLSDEEWRHALIDTGALRVRKRWPASEPFAVSLRKPAWLGRRVLVLDPLRWDVPLGSAHVGLFHVSLCGNMQLADERRALHYPLGSLPAGRQRLDCAIEVFERNDGDAKGWSNELWLGEHVERDAPDCEPSGFRSTTRAPRLVATAELGLEVEVVPTLDAALPPMSSPELDAAVRGALVVRLTTWPPRHEERELVLRSDDELDPALARVALALEVEVLREGEVRNAGFLHRYDGCEPFNACDAPHALGLTALPRDLESNLRELERWSLRVRSTDDHVLSDWDAERRWKGAFELSLAELFEHARELRKR